MRKFNIIIMTMALLAWAGMAQAATISFDASSIVTGISGNSDWTQIKKNSQGTMYEGPSALTGTVNGVTWTLQAVVAGGGQGVLAMDVGNDDVYDPNKDGLGANSNVPPYYGMLDPAHENMLQLTFSEGVYLSSLSFSHIGSEEKWAYSINGGSSWITGAGDLSSPWYQYGTASADTGNILVTSVLISSGGNTAGRAGHITFRGFEAQTAGGGEETPEPMTMMLLGSALGVSTMVRRRFKK